MILDTSTSRKRHRPTAPLDVTQVRRSVRATRYLGFKAPSMSDNRKRDSHVKPRQIPEIGDSSTTQDMEVQPAHNQIPPPPTPIKTIQHLGINMCGIPPEEIIEEKLMQGVEEQNLGDA